MLSNYFPIKFRNVELIVNEPLWKQIIGLYVYEWDEEAPNAASLFILGFEFHFLLGKWVFEDDLPKL
jgi:hypothetical protein